MKPLVFILLGALFPLWAFGDSDCSALSTDVSRVIVLEARRQIPVDADLLDSPAHLIYRVAPEYPRNLRERGIMGYVEIVMVVDTIGRVRRADVIRADHPDFSRAALEATRDWIFEPALIDGHPVAVRVVMPFRFIIPSLLAQR